MGKHEEGSVNGGYSNPPAPQRSSGQDPGLGPKSCGTRESDEDSNQPDLRGNLVIDTGLAALMTVFFAWCCQVRGASGEEQVHECDAAGPPRILKILVRPRRSSRSRPRKLDPEIWTLCLNLRRVPGKIDRGTQSARARIGGRHVF